MEINKYYETLVQRDLNFYVLPGGYTIFGVFLILKIYGTDELWNKTVASGITENSIINVVLFLVASYAMGYVLYMIHNKTVGDSVNLKRHLLLQRYIFPDKPSETILKMRAELVSAILGEKFIENIEQLNNTGDLLQLYFNADKYVRQKNKDFYLTYIGRLTATSRFCGVMSVACSFLALCLLGAFFYFQYALIIPTFCGMAGLFVLSFWFFKQSITDQEELVWNIIQSVFLIKNSESKT